MFVQGEMEIPLGDVDTAVGDCGAAGRTNEFTIAIDGAIPICVDPVPSESSLWKRLDMAPDIRPCPHAEYLLLVLLVASMISRAVDDAIRCWSEPYC